MAKIAKWIFAIILAVAFIGLGATKLTPRVNAELHATMVSTFNKFPTVAPWNSFGWSGETIRVLIGVTEVTFGALVLCPHYTRLSAFVFLAPMATAFWNQFQISHTQPLPVLAVVALLSVILFALSGDAVAKKATTTAPVAKKNK